jgi:hypothetical protein
MTTHTPLTRYSATNGALASGFIIAELHQLMGHDQPRRARIPTHKGHWALGSAARFLKSARIEANMP